MRTSKWVTKWVVHGSNSHVWTVAQDRNGNWGCSCPKWIFQKTRPREDCHHIAEIKSKITKAVTHREAEKPSLKVSQEKVLKKKAEKISNTYLDELLYGKRKITT